jgi:protein SCO1
MMNRVLPIIFALLLSACSTASDSGPPPLEGARMGGAFALTSEDGKPVKDSDFAGKYRLVYFGYTFCPDVCPVDMARLMQGFSVLEKQDKAKADKVQPIFISVDPKRDTPDAVKQFTAAFHPRLLGLTGSEAEVETVAKRYGVYFERGTPGADGSYLVNHSNNAVLYGPKGEPLAIIPHVGKPEDVAGELSRWIQ